MNSKIGYISFLDFYTENMYDCILNLVKLRQEGRVAVPDFLYHGTTTTFLHDILMKGLLPEKAGQCWKEDSEKRIFLTDSMYAAELFALKAVVVYGGEPIIFVVDVSNLKSNLALDEETFEKEYPTVFDTYKQYSFEEPISPREIRDYYILPKDKSIFQLIETIRDNYLKNSQNKV